MENKVTVWTPPGNIQLREGTSKRATKIFLAGTIEMGKSDDWQKEVINKLANPEKEPSYGSFFAMAPTLISERPNNEIIIFNPRRDEWDDSWSQEFTNPQFYQQVNWELDALEKADIIIMNILPDSKSPISLMELGLFARTRKLKVICPKGFYRKGNVDIVCNRYDVPMFENLDELVKSLNL